MSEFLDYPNLWLHAVLVLLCGPPLIAGIAVCCAHRAQRAVTIRLVWQSAIAGTGLLMVLEFTGAPSVILEAARGTQPDQRDITPALTSIPEPAAINGAGINGAASAPMQSAPVLRAASSEVGNRGARAVADRLPQAVVPKTVVPKTEDSVLPVVSAERRVAPPIEMPSRLEETQLEPANVSIVPRLAGQPEPHAGSRTARSTPIDDVADAGYREAPAVFIPTAINAESGRLAIVVWLGIALGLLLRLCLGHWRARRLQSEYSIVEHPGHIRLVQDLARRMGLRRRVVLRESQTLSGPVAYGVCRPTIAWPPHFMDKLDSQQSAAVIVHELAHVSARDAVWQLVVDLLSCLLWWQPLLWYMRRQFRFAAEAAADEACLLLPDGPASLAECLVALSRRRLAHPSPAWMAALETPSRLTRRVERLLRLAPNSTANVRRARTRLLGVLLLLMMAIVAVLGTNWLIPYRFSTEKDPTMNATWTRSLAGITLLALISPAIPDLIGDDEKPDRPEARERDEPKRESPNRESRERRDGDRPEARREGDRPQPEARREGDRPRPEARRDGDRPQPEARRDGDRPRPETRRDGDRPRPEARREGDRPRPEARRDGDRPRPEARRDGDRPRPEGRHDTDGEEGNADAARRRLLQQAERLAKELRELGDKEGKEVAEKRAYLSRGLLSLRQQLARQSEAREHDERDAPRDEAQRRERHLRAAIENLKAGGFHEMARDLQRRAASLHREGGDEEGHHHEGDGEDHHGHGHEHGEQDRAPLAGQVGALRGEVNELKKQLNEIRRLLESRRD